MKRDFPYAIVVILACVIFAVGVMLWSMGDSGRERDVTAGENTSGQTTGMAPPRSDAAPAPAPTAPRNDPAADSARTPEGPLNKSR